MRMIGNISWKVCFKGKFGHKPTLAGVKLRGGRNGQIGMHNELSFLSESSYE